MKRISLGLVVAFFLTGCGYEGKYRYECQIPENWENEECNPPLCVASGECTKDLLGFDPTETTVEIIPTEETVAP